jgi:hypothetical protein
LPTALYFDLGQLLLIGFCFARLLEEEVRLIGIISDRFSLLLSWRS